jgi:hypothetical protein
MKITVNENKEIVLKDVYLGVGFETKEGEEFFICMRDGGFEFSYGGEDYSANNGEIIKFNKNNSNHGKIQKETSYN